MSKPIDRHCMEEILRRIRKYNYTDVTESSGYWEKKVSGKIGEYEIIIRATEKEFSIRGEWTVWARDPGGLLGWVQICTVPVTEFSLEEMREWYDSRLGEAEESLIGAVLGGLKFNH